MLWQSDHSCRTCGSFYLLLGIRVAFDVVLHIFCTSIHAYCLIVQLVWVALASCCFAIYLILLSPSRFFEISWLTLGSQLARISQFVEEMCLRLCSVVFHKLFLMLCLLCKRNLVFKFHCLFFPPFLSQLI